MKSKTFISERGRPIAIVVAEYISFQFPHENNREFYWINKSDWNESYGFHMKQKNWYSPAMTEFIDKSILIDEK
jgi:hypothetical protein